MSWDSVSSKRMHCEAKQSMREKRLVRQLCRNRVYLRNSKHYRYSYLLSEVKLNGFLSYIEVQYFINTRKDLCKRNAFWFF